MVTMASGIVHVLVRTTTMAELPNMAAILQKIGWQRHTGLPCTSLILDIHAMINIIDTCQNRVSADQYHGLKLTAHRGHVFVKMTADQGWLSDWIVGSCQVDLLNTGQDWSEAGWRIKSYLNFKFYSIQMFCAALFCVNGDFRNSKQKAEEKPHHKVKKLKSKFYFFLG